MLWPEVKLRVRGAPRAVTYDSIHRFFSKYGHITFIKIEDLRFGKFLLTFW